MGEAVFWQMFANTFLEKGRDCLCIFLRGKGEASYNTIQSASISKDKDSNFVVEE